ncbi:MAG: YqgE/AlgH family protein [Pirellulaceae bacterium]
MSNRIVKTSKALSESEFSLSGKLLVAAPHYDDAIFGQTVCLVVHHTSEGAVAIVLNRGFRDEAEGLREHLSSGGLELREGVLHLGGPDSGPVVALHDCDELAEFEPAEGVYMAAQIESLRALVAASAKEDSDSSSALKIIVGQADWKAGQLDAQFAEGKWYPLPVSSDLVFVDPCLMWPAALCRVGNQLVFNMTKAARPAHVLCN